MAIWPSKVVANKLFSRALVLQVATCRFHACVHRRRNFIEYLTLWCRKHFCTWSYFYVSYFCILLLIVYEVCKVKGMQMLDVFHRSRSRYVCACYCLWFWVKNYLWSLVGGGHLASWFCQTWKKSILLVMICRCYLLFDILYLLGVFVFLTIHFYLCDNTKCLFVGLSFYWALAVLWVFIMRFHISGWLPLTLLDE